MSSRKEVEGDRSIEVESRADLLLRILLEDLGCTAEEVEVHRTEVEVVRIGCERYEEERKGLARGERKEGWRVSSTDLYC